MAFSGLDPEVAEAFDREASALTAPLSEPLANELRRTFEPAAKAYHTIVARDAWAGHRSWAERYRSRYDPVVWQRLKRVDELSAADHAHADSTFAAVRRAWTEFFADHDFLIIPATPCAAPLKADCTLELRSRLIALTAPASLGGRPVLTVPVPLPSGLTTGLQIVVGDAQSPAIDWLLRHAETKA